MITLGRCREEELPRLMPRVAFRLPASHRVELNPSLAAVYPIFALFPPHATHVLRSWAGAYFSHVEAGGDLMMVVVRDEIGQGGLGDGVSIGGVYAMSWDSRSLVFAAVAKK